jgi:hypothetical protein
MTSDNEDPIAHIGLPPKKSKPNDSLEEDDVSQEDDPRSWRPSEDEYVGAIDRGDGWEPAVIIEQLSMEEDSSQIEFIYFGEDA